MYFTNLSDKFAKVWIFEQYIYTYELNVLA